MTINNEQIQALLEKAESDDLALNGNEISNQLRHLADNEIDSDSFAVVTENYNGMETEFERPITDLAIDAAEMIDKLLAERDADKALIDEQAKRIAELECVCAESYQVVGALADSLGVFNDTKTIKALDNLSAQTLVHTDVLPFSVEARTLTIKLPSQTDFDDPLSAYEAIKKCRDAFAESCAAAGITLDVGE